MTLALALSALLALAGRSAACGYGAAGSAYAAPVVAPVVAASCYAPQALVTPAAPAVKAEVQYQLAPAVAPVVVAPVVTHSYGYGAASAFTARAVVVRHRAAVVVGHAAPQAVVVRGVRARGVRAQAVRVNAGRANVAVNAGGVRVRVRQR